jgi:hypothetical protein
MKASNSHKDAEVNSVGKEEVISSLSSLGKLIKQLSSSTDGSEIDELVFCIDTDGKLGVKLSDRS